jgi:SAM-dependent methyltransferase
MRNVVYSPRVDRLIYLHEKATPTYWDSVWVAEGKPPPASENDDVARVTREFLPAGSRILEGGCGRADKVNSMAHAGFNAVGIDFAASTVEQARRDFPNLDIRQGDVRALDFPDGSFDGYWSIGVIEHFWEGYDAILAEMARVVRRGGVLFLTAPWFSPYRRQRLRAGGYPTADYASEPDNFYQFALDRPGVSRDLERHGFEVLRWSGLASEVSMLEDMTSIKGPVNWLLGSRGSIVKRVVRRVVSRGLDSWCGHSFLAVARRK